MTLRQLLALDQRLSARLRVAERPGALRSLAALLAHSGDSWFWFLGLMAVWLRGEPPWRAWALNYALAILSLAVVVMALKFSIRRRRPQGEWGAIYRNTDPHSFPSGHAARAFLLAALSLGLGPPWLSPILLIWAPLVSLARVAMGVHYLSDVLAGAFLGLLGGGLWLAFL
jgi:undecaprenyl-diphosphatase